MPVAVEFIARLLKNVFTIDAVDGSVAQAEFARLDTMIDPGFRALSSATSPRGFEVVERQYGHTFQELGAGAFSVGVDLQRDAVVFNAINGILGGADVFGAGGGSGKVAEVWGGGGGSGKVAEVWGGGGGSGRVADIFSGQGGGSGRVAEVWGGGGGSGAVADVYGAGGGSGTQADFGVLDRRLFATGHDLEALGADLASLAHVNSKRALDAVEGRIRTDLSALDDDFSSLSRGANALAKDIRIDNSHTDLNGVVAGSGDLLRGLDDFTVQLHDISVDFGRLAHGANANDGGITAGDIFGGGGGSGFSALQHDISVFSGSLQGLATPLAGMLVPAVHVA